MEVVYFLRDYWPFISTGILVIFSIILMVIKKKPITEIIDPGLMQKIIDFVILAEGRFGSGNGSSKLSFVLGKIREIRPDDFDELKDLYSDMVEYVLCAPQKKEQANEKVK